MEECPYGWFTFGWYLSISEEGHAQGRSLECLLSAFLLKKEFCHRNRDSHSVSRPISTTSSSKTRGINPLLSPSTHRNLRRRNWCRTGEILSISVARSNSFTIACKVSLLAFLVLWNLGDIWSNSHFSSLELSDGRLDPVLLTLNVSIWPSRVTVACICTMVGFGRLCSFCLHLCSGICRGEMRACGRLLVLVFIV